MHLPRARELNFSQKMLVDKAIFITFFRAINDEGKQVYVFYAVNGIYLDEVNSMITSGHIESDQLSEYGQVIAADYGEPSEAVKEMMARDYNFNLDTLNNPDAPATRVEL